MASRIGCLRTSHANRTWSARCRERCRAGITLTRLPEASHLHGRHGRVEALIAMRAAGAIQRLLIVVRGQHAEGHRLTGLQRYLLQPVRCRLSHEIEMRSLS